MRKNKALILGGTGQDGIFLNYILQKNGYDVISTSYISELKPKILSYLGIPVPNILKLDLHNYIQLKDLVLEFNPTEIYNLAGQSSVSKSFEDPEMTFKTNFDGVLNLIKVIEKYNKDIKLFQASSSEMFGIQQKKSFVESDPLNPISPYGISKASAHVICNYFREKMNMNIYCGILFNHESELRSKSFVFRKITSILSEIKNGLRKKLLIGNLEISRDWGYAPEYVEAIYLLMREDIPRDLIIATGETYSLRQVIQKTIDQLRLKCQVEEICEISEKFIRTREIEFNSANPRQAKSVLGWQANVKIDGLIEKLLKFERWISNR